MAAISLQIETLELLPSTNTYLKERAQRGELSPGWVARALRQTQGRGRGERVWESAKEESLTVSYWLDLAAHHLELPQTQRLPLLVGLALWRAAARRLERLGLEARRDELGLKWPNDLWLGEGKLAGILCELVRQPQGQWGVVAGVGLNLGGQPKDLGRGRHKATWEAHWGDKWLPEEALVSLGEELYRLLERLAEGEWSLLAKEWYSHSLHRERWVHLHTAPWVKEGGSTLSWGDREELVGAGGASGPVGLCRGLGEWGELLLEGEGGEIEAYTLGDLYLK